MKVLFVIDSLGTGGSERSTSYLWYYLRKHKIEFSIIALGHRSEGIEKEIIDEGFKVSFLRSQGFFSQSREISAYIKKHNPDIVHSILFKSNLRVRLSRVTNRFKHVESLVNCTYDPVRLKDPRIGLLSFYYYKYLDKFTSVYVDHFLPNAENVKKHYQEALGISGKKMSVIYRGRHVNSFHDQREELRQRYLKEFELPENTIVILHVGRQEFQKGHLILLHTITRLKEYAMPVAFVFVGREGNTTQDIRQFLSKATVTPKLFWLGHRYDVAQLMVAADIFVFPSLYEGMAGVLIEAQAASLPVVCSDIPVLNEIVLQNENALMFKAGNEDELYTCLDTIIKDKDMRQRMGRKSIENFMRKFMIENVNEQTLLFYKRLVS